MWSKHLYCFISVKYLYRHISGQSYSLTKRPQKVTTSAYIPYTPYQQHFRCKGHALSGFFGRLSTFCRCTLNFKEDWFRSNHSSQTRTFSSKVFTHLWLPLPWNDVIFFIKISLQFFAALIDIVMKPLMDEYFLRGKKSFVKICNFFFAPFSRPKNWN